MKTLKKTLVIGSSSLLALSGMAGVALAAPAVDQADQTLSSAETQEASQVSTVVSLAEVDGLFDYTQTEVSSIGDILKNFGNAAQYLCGARPVAEASAAVEDWTIRVTGDVNNAYAATYGELVESEEIQSVLLGCACAGNPSDGKAMANAEVKGLPLVTLIAMADPAEDVNTVVVVSADGYSVALPLDYVSMRYCPIVFDINGAPLAESVGGTNQLWLGSTAANYFARDIVEITLENRQTPPPYPNSDEAREAYKNLPNVGIFYGGDVA